MLSSKFSKRNNFGLLKDFGLNILASFVLTLATQILAYPFIGRMVSIEEYGFLLTIMGIVNILGVSLGNPLNNTRILLQSEYEKRNLNGDYNPIFVLLLILNIIIVFIVTTLFYKGINVIVIGAVITSVLVLFRSYYTADYRIKINYKKNLYASLFGLLGYLFGIGITSLIELWILIFIFGELFACIYIFLSAEIVRDKFKFTSLFKISVYKYIYIMIAAVLSSLLVYMDRFYIYPVLGPEYVSIYNVASFLGKTAGIILGPVAGVLLSYYVKETSISIKDFYLRTGIFTSISFVFYLIILLLGIPIAQILYPTIVDFTRPYFAIANLGALVFILGNLIQPTLLRYCSEKWQPIIQGIHFFLYLLLGFIGMKANGLMGFCYSILIVNVIRVILMISITTYSLKYSEVKSREV